MKKVAIFIVIGLVLLAAIIISVLLFISTESVEEGTLRGVILGETSSLATSKHVTDDFDIEKIIDGTMPTGLAFDNKGRLFFSQITGFIFVVDGDEATLFANVPDSQAKHDSKIEGEGEAGPMAIAIDPDFEENGYLYVYYVSDKSGKIGRFTEKNGVGQDFKIIFDDVPFYRIHNGGDLTFGPDGKLYLSTGDATDINEELKENNPAQDLNSKAGKILRINKDGSIPDDNPFPNSYTYALGFRNVFGFDIDQETGLIYAGEQGINCCEELNLVEEGKNYGWAVEMGFNPESEFTDPLFAWGIEDRVVPTGVVSYKGDIYGDSFKNNVFLTTWRTREIVRFILSEDGRKIDDVQAYRLLDVKDKVARARITGLHAGNIHEGQVTESGSATVLEGLVDIAEGPDGYLYFSDVRGVYRLVPKRQD